MADIAVILAFAFLGGLVAYALKQPVLIGYLLAGIIIGPHSFGLVKDSALVDTLASIGVVLLMFTIGMEFSLGELRRVGKVGVGGAIIQVAVTALIGFAVASRLFHWTSSDAIFFGFLIALSSTMIVLKILMERGETNSPHGRILIAILLVQDLGALPLMVILPALGQQNVLYSLGIAMGRTLLVLGVMAVIGIWAIPRIMGQVAGMRSREIFMMAVLAIGVGAAFSTTYFGVSAAFGAFAAGMLLGRSNFTHQALAEIIPLRNGFAALFFISLGMLTSPRFVADHWREVVAITVTIIVLKYVVSAITARSFGYSLKTALLVGAGLVPVGEFSFILAKAGLDSGVVSDHLYSLILSSALFTIVLTPFLLDLAGGASRFLAKRPRLTSWFEAGKDRALSQKKSAMTGHVIICGYGGVGSNLAETLGPYDFPYVVVELNPQVVSDLDALGIPTVYGDAGNPHILEMAGLKEAKVLALTCPDPLSLTNAVSYARQSRPDLVILARATDPWVDERLEKLGVSELIEPKFEASLEFVRHALQTYSVDRDEVERLVCTDLREIAREERKKKRFGARRGNG